MTKLKYTEDHVELGKNGNLQGARSVHSNFKFSSLLRFHWILVSIEFHSGLSLIEILYEQISCIGDSFVKKVNGM